MKKLITVLACLSLCTFAVHADNGWGLFGSYWNPSDGDSAFGPGVRLAVEMIPGVQLDMRVSYFNDVMKESEGPSLKVIPLEAGLNLIAPAADRLNVYGGIGIGYYLMDSDADVDNEVGFFLNGGVEFVMIENEAFYGGTRASLFAEAMYRSVSADKAGNDGKDMDLDGLVLSGGLMVRW